MARRSPPRTGTRAAVAAAITAVLAVGTGCGGPDPYCERARSAFDQIGELRSDPQAVDDPQEALARLKTAFGALRDGVPEEVQSDVDTLLRYVDSLRTPEDVAREEPADVRTAGEHLADWLGRNCEE
jgi:hypothetical protein